MHDDNTSGVYLEKVCSSLKINERADRGRSSPISKTMRENESLVELTREKNTGSWLQRLMPDGATQMAVSAEQDELAIGFEYRRKALQLAVDSKLQAVEEACNHVLVPCR